MNKTKPGAQFLTFEGYLSNSLPMNGDVAVLRCYSLANGSQRDSVMPVIIGPPSPHFFFTFADNFFFSFFFLTLRL